MKRILEHLYRDYNSTVRDPLWKSIYLSEAFKKLLSLKPFQRLGRIKQLGPAYHVYPGAVHTRLNHSLGVFHISKELLKSFLISGEGDFLTEEGVKAFLCAALFHDLGHFPFAHSLKELPLKDHEELSAEIILGNEFSKTLKDTLETDPYLVASIIDSKLNTRGNREIAFFRKVLSGVLDPDKLDYLNRDAYFCGIPYGIQDTSFIIRKLVISGTEPAMDQSGIMAVENLLFSKYLMYKSVYWHKTVRIATAMIKKAIFMGLDAKILRPEELYNIDDEQFYQILSNRIFPPFHLLKKVMHRDFYKSVWETDFDPENPVHVKLTDLYMRYEMSEKIASALSRKSGKTVYPVSVIIDIPEPVSFEIDLKIVSNGRPESFTESGSVFTPSVIDGFTSSLRKIRIFLPQELTAISFDYGDYIL